MKGIRHRRVFAVLPTLLTLGNGVCGFGCITLAVRLGPEKVTGHEMWIAAGLIYLAMIFDAFDGAVARLTDQTSEFGAHLDSLCDMISFGLAPAFLMLRFLEYGQAGEAAPLKDGAHPLLLRLVWVIAALFVVCAALRLARFNSETDEEDSHIEFSGLPSPAAAGTVASFPIAYYLLLHGAQTAEEPVSNIATWPAEALKLALPVVTLLLACLMVSRVRYMHTFNQWIHGRRGRRHMIQLVFVAAVIAASWNVAVPVLLCCYSFVPPLMAGWRRLRKRRATSQTSDDLAD